MEFYISPQSGQFYMINVLENQWLSVTYINATTLIRKCGFKTFCAVTLYKNKNGALRLRVFVFVRIVKF